MYVHPDNGASELEEAAIDCAIPSQSPNRPGTTKPSHNNSDDVTDNQHTSKSSTLGNVL
jgi:hypothetical protein